MYNKKFSGYGTIMWKIIKLINVLKIFDFEISELISNFFYCKVYVYVYERF